MCHDTHVNWCIKYPCVGVQTFEHSELKIKECSNDEIAHSFGPYSEEILNNKYYISAIYKIHYT